MELDRIQQPHNKRSNFISFSVRRRVKFYDFFINTRINFDEWMRKKKYLEGSK